LLRLLKANSFSFFFAFHVYTLWRHARENLNRLSSTLVSSCFTRDAAPLCSVEPRLFSFSLLTSILSPTPLLSARFLPSVHFLSVESLHSTYKTSSTMYGEGEGLYRVPRPVHSSYETLTASSVPADPPRWEFGRR
jgi:hypothetical protein